MANPAPLANLVQVRGRFLRSVHLERDFRNGVLGGYHLTESAYHTLKAVVSALDQPAQRAITLVGPYGAGKSAFCAFLAQLLEKHQATSPETEKLTHYDEALYRRLTAQCSLIPVLIVGSRQPMANALISGLMKALETGGYDCLRTQLLTEAEDILHCAVPTARQVADLYQLAACLSRSEGADGLLLIIDELGKFLEYAALHPKQGDIFALQEVAEVAARSGENPLLVVGVLHQGADAYAHKLGRTYQAEWAKVSERYHQLPFQPSDGERIDMVGRALHQSADLTLNDGFEQLIQKCLGEKLAPSGLEKRFATMARTAYPLHPVTLLALPALFRRTGQSHRSLFNFLSGEEPHAFGSFLRETAYTPENPPLFPPDRLFDYAAEVLAGSWGISIVARHWAEATELIDRAVNVSEGARRILKCIGLFGILRDPRLRANRETLALALTGGDGAAPNIEEDLLELTSRQLLAYSKTRKTFRLWEGGDVDVEEELAKARLGQQVSSTLHVAQDLCPPPRLIARRHSYKTGTLRTVEVTACGAMQLDSAVAAAEGRLTVLLCLALTPEELESTQERGAQIKQPGLLIALAQETDVLRETAADVTAVHRVEVEMRSQLAGDRAARRELAARRFESETAFQAEWDRLFAPWEDSATWYYYGEPHTFEANKSFSTFLSKMADDSYYAAPHLRNELVNRRQLSSAAAAGRRTLIEAMMTHGKEKQLGFKGAPPELSMYECLLRATRLHREVEPGRWAFCDPNEDSPSRLRPCWDALSNIIFADPLEPRNVATIFTTLSAPPYGLTEGVLPVLLCAFLLTYPNETTCYREGTYIPEPGVADFEVLLRRPELFAVAGSRLTGERALVVQRLAEKLNLSPYVVAVVRALIRMVKGLPEYAWKTRRLPEPVLAMREAFSRTKSPEQLLFHDLPLALGVTFFSQERVDAATIDSFFNALNAALKSWGQATARIQEQARNQLLSACSLSEDEAGWVELRKQAGALEGRVIHPTLLPFIRSAAEIGDDRTVQEKVLAQVAKRPPSTWTDMDVDRFAGQAQAVGELFREAVDALHRPVSVTKAADLLSQEEQQVRLQLTQQLRKVIRGNWAASIPPRILRAALVALLDELNEQQGGDATDE